MSEKSYEELKAEVAAQGKTIAGIVRGSKELDRAYQATLEELSRVKAERDRLLIVLQEIDGLNAQLADRLHLATGKNLSVSRAGN